ncbi:hypothetical protein JCM16303_006958 [Sporobolomyces ruberrimus]
MSTDHLEPRPVTRARSSTASSDFLLLTTEHESTPLLSPSPSSSIPLPPPRFRPLLQLAAVLDLVCVLGYGSTGPLTKLPLSAVSLNSLRPCIVLYAVTSVKVRENAPVLLGQFIVSSLVLLYRLNELVQTTSSTSPPPTSLLPSLPARFSNPISTWYLTSFLFSLLHYILYILFVGIRKRRNPFNGSAGTTRRNRSASKGKVRRTLRRNTWTEETWEGRQEWVSSRRSVGSNDEEDDGEQLGRDGDRGFEEEEEGRPGQKGEGETESILSSLEEGSISDLSSSTSSSDEEEEEDENELIDIPKPGHTLHGTNMLRNRSSRTSLLSLPLSEPSTSGRGNALKASRGYGSMRSLCKDCFALLAGETHTYV